MPAWGAGDEGFQPCPHARVEEARGAWHERAGQNELPEGRGPHNKLLGVHSDVAPSDVRDDDVPALSLVRRRTGSGGRGGAPKT